METTYKHSTSQTKNNQEKFYKPLRKRSSDLINYRKTCRRRRKGTWQHPLAFYPISDVTRDPVNFLNKFTRLEKRILDLIIRHTIAYVNVFPSQAWLAEQADCSITTVNRVLAFFTDLQIIDKLNYNTLERVHKQEFMTCSYQLSGWFNNLSIRELLRPLFPALVIVPLMLLFSPDIAAQQYAESKQLAANEVGILKKEYIYKESKERTEAPPGYADRLSRYWDYNLFGELRGPVVGLYEAINYFKKELYMNVSMPKRSLTSIPESSFNTPQANQSWQMHEQDEQQYVETEEDYLFDRDAQPVYPAAPTDNVKRSPFFPGCEYPFEGGVQARREFYKRNPHHSESECPPCKQRRRG